MPDGGELDCLTAVVTGSVRGIGRAIAVAFAEDGANVVINARNSEDAANAVAAEVDAAGGKALVHMADVANPHGAAGLIDAAVKTFGRLDILVNNAGGIAGKAQESYAASVSDDDFRNTMDRNLMGTVYCSQAAAVHMKAANYGRIVNTSSQAGMRAQSNGNYASYGVAKAGVISWTQYLAQELGRYNITVNALAPAYVGTERLMQQSFSQIENVRKQLKVPLGRLAEPDDIAKVMEFFVTDLGDYVTGQTISVCGGAINF